MKQSAESRADEAARIAGGDCDTVRRLDPQVRALDSRIHGSAFVVDVWINRCLPLATSAPAQQ